MKREFGTLEEAVNFISNKMALKKVKDASNSENEFLNEQETLKMMLVEKNKNEVQVKERINAIYNTIIKENPLIEFPQGFLVDVGNFVAVQVKEKGLSTPEQISTSSITTKELVEKIYNENYEIVDKSYYGFENEILDENETQKENMISEEEFKEFETAMKEKYGDDFYTVEEIKKVGKIAEGILDVLNEEIEKLIDKEKNGDKVAADLLNIISELTGIKSLYFDDKEISTDDIESCRAIKLKLESIKKEKTEFEEIIDSILREIYDDDFAKKLVEEDNKQENQNSTEDRKIIITGVNRDCRNFTAKVKYETQKKALSHNVDKIKNENEESLGIYKEQSKAYIKLFDDLLAEQSGYVVEENKQKYEVIKNTEQSHGGKKESKEWRKLFDDLLAEQSGYVVEKNKQKCEVIKNTEQSYGGKKESKEWIKSFDDIYANYVGKEAEKQNGSADIEKKQEEKQVLTVNISKKYTGEVVDDAKMKVAQKTGETISNHDISSNCKDEFSKQIKNDILSTAQRYSGKGNKEYIKELDDLCANYVLPETAMKAKKDIEQNVSDEYVKKPENDNIIQSYGMSEKEKNGIEQKKEFFINSIIDKPEIGKELIKRYIEKYNATYDPIILEKISEIEKILAEAEKNKVNDDKEQKDGKFDENPEDNPETRDDDDDAR